MAAIFFCYARFGTDLLKYMRGRSGWIVPNLRVWFRGCPVSMPVRMLRCCKMEFSDAHQSQRECSDVKL